MPDDLEPLHIAPKPNNLLNIPHPRNFDISMMVHDPSDWYMDSSGRIGGGVLLGTEQELRPTHTQHSIKGPTNPPM